jgi:hypothetical protein
MRSDLSRILPRQNSTGTLRGTQNVGYGSTKIDGSNNVITIGDSITLDGNNDVININTDSDASITLGAIKQGGIVIGFGLAVTNTDGSQVGLGSIPGTTEFGFFATDADGTLVMKIVNGTLYTYNVTSGDNVVQIGKLTNGEYGGAFAQNGSDLVDGLGT